MISETDKYKIACSGRLINNREEEQKKGLMNEETDVSETGRRLSYNVGGWMGPDP